MGSYTTIRNGIEGLNERTHPDLYARARRMLEDRTRERGEREMTEKKLYDCGVEDCGYCRATDITDDQRGT